MKSMFDHIYDEKVWHFSNKNFRWEYGKLTKEQIANCRKSKDINHQKELQGEKNNFILFIS